MLKDDGRTIIWDLTDTEPYRTYTLNISMRLAADVSRETCQMEIFL